jgi:hypothetical protein
VIAVGDLVRWANCGDPSMIWEVDRLDGGYAWLRDIHTGFSRVGRAADCRWIGRRATVAGAPTDILDRLFPWRTWIETPSTGECVARRGRELIYAKLCDGIWALPGRPATVVDAWTPMAPLEGK